MRQVPSSSHGRERIIQRRATPVVRLGHARGRLERRRQMLRDGMGQCERTGKTGLGGQADQARTAKMFMLTIQEIQRAVRGSADTAELLNNAFGQGAEIGHRADFGGETGHQIQEMCR